MAGCAHAAPGALPGPDNITGLILAGGRGSRMGGVAKGLQLLHGRPLLSHVLERLHAQVGPVLINANQELARHAEFGWPVLPDEDPNFAGPLSGLLAGLQACTTEWLLCVPCDSPQLPRDLGQRLATALAAQPTPAPDLAYAVCQGQAQPVFCLLRRSLADSAAQFLAAGERKLERWQQAQRHIALPFERPGDVHAFINVNSLSELQQLQQQLGPQQDHV